MMSTFRAPSWLRAAAALVLAGGALPAQTKDSGARIERVADGVYAIIHEMATEEWPHGNTGVIVTDDGVLVVDAAYLPSRARADIALIRSVTDRPVRWLVYTHWHFDHNNGAVAYRDTFPQVVIVSERETAEWIGLNGTMWRNMAASPNGAKRTALAKLEAQLAQGRDTAGKALGADARRALEANVRQRRAEIEELSELEVVIPDLRFEQSLTLVLGGRRIELRDHGRANSPHDVTVYLPDERVLFTGDIVVQSPYPYPFMSWPVAWIGVLRELEAMPIAALVPGHGPVMRDHAYVRQVRELLEAATTRVAALVREGKTIEEIRAAVTLHDFRARWGMDTDAAAREDWRQVADALVERAWRGVRGQGG